MKQKIEGGKTKPLTEKRLREIIREEIAKIPPTYVPVPYPKPETNTHPQQNWGHRCPGCGMWLMPGQAHMCITC